MSTQKGQAKIFYPSELEPVRMDADDDIPSAPGISMASVFENQCLTPDEMAEYAERLFR